MSDWEAEELEFDIVKDTRLHQHWHDPDQPHQHQRHHKRTRRILVAEQLDVGASVVKTGTAQIEDPPGSGIFVTATDATVAWSEDSSGTFLSIVDNGSTDGVGSVTVTGVADGDASLTATATYADGRTASTGPDDPDVFTVVTPVAPPAAIQVAVT